MDPTVRARLAQQLVQALREARGGELEMRRLFELYYAPVVHFFSRRGVAPEDCLDLTQETFLDIYKGIGSFRAEARFDTWLFAVAANAHREMLRRRGAEKRSGQEVPLAEGSAEAEEGQPRGVELASAERLPDETTLDRERTRLLAAAIEELPAQMRKCLLLRIDQDLKYREIAVLLRISVETVKAHLFQARQRLAGRLAGPAGRPAEGSS
ncbi:MAG TPA: sigma-70 family RNA polymerase sigma factor [Thermoanaerobaculia bacterium]|nr:sigma-70 family RNA polymerase sigma factor [Thermoanaerobaculia bacterium]